NTDKQGEYYVRDAGGNILAVYRTHSVYDRVLRFKILVVEGSGVLSPTDGLGTVLTDVLTADYSGTSLIDGLKGVVLSGHSGWVGTYTNKPIGFYWNADPTLRSTLLYSGNAWIDAMRASAPQVHRDALLLAGTGVQPLFFSAMDQPAEGRKLIQHYSTQMPQPVCQSIWNSVQAQYIPGNHVANASALYTKMTPQFKPMLLSQMTQQIQQNFQQAQPQAAAFYNAVMADNTVWSAPVLRANNGPWTSGITQIVNMYANDGALQSFFNTWAGGPSALAAAVTPSYKLDIVYSATPYATTRDMCLTATTDELTGVISAIPGITYYGLKHALVEAGIENARLNDMEQMASSGDTLSLAEHHLYGSSRLGVQRYDSVTIANISHLPEESTVQERSTLRNRVPWYSYDFADLVDSTKRTPWAPGPTGNAYTGIWNTNRTLGRKFFEVTDHLGNVLATVLDRKTGATATGEAPVVGGLYDHWHADIAQASDYYPGGMIMPGRYKEYDWSRMGSQSQQKDDEVYGKGNLYAYKYRMNDARINRFFSPDPLHRQYPHNSDYAFAENDLTRAIELEGLEKYIVTIDKAWKNGAQDITYTKIQLPKAGSLGNGVAVRLNYFGDTRYFYGNSAASAQDFTQYYEGNGIPGHPFERYNDSRGYATIGYGHFMSNADKARWPNTASNSPFAVGSKMSSSEADALFAADYPKHKEMTLQSLKTSLSGNKLDAMIDFGFNIKDAEKRIGEFTPEKGGNFFLEYMKGGAGLEKRRIGESVLFNEGDYIKFDQVKGNSATKIEEQIK
ncbi:MAG TPA: hypothetical protein VL092_03780, partial [Chitinophagaceae bacterium]|nr:hypothetical protein [Chitinophagaceae bacterium]